LKPCCGLDVHYPTQALESVKDPGNIFDLNPKWARTFPSLLYFSWVIYRVPPNKIVEGGLYKYPMKNISRKAKFLPTLGLN
jgi:hypothetical protein